jgi:hypothetical protein
MDFASGHLKEMSVDASVSEAASQHLGLWLRAVVVVVGGGGGRGHGT